VTPSSTTVTVGSSQQCAATGVYVDGSVQDVTGLVTWTSFDTRLRRSPAPA
jgi:hypothetical protein